MHLSLKSFKAAAVCAVVMGLMLSVSAGAASAAPALWSSVSNGTVAGTLTVTNGSTTTTCTISRSVFAYNNAGQARVNDNGQPAATCANGNGFLFPQFSLGSKVGAAYSLDYQAGASGQNPFYPAWNLASQYTSVAFSVPFTNGTVSTPSKVTFNNTLIGGNVRVTGTLNVTKTGGALITLL